MSKRRGMRRRMIVKVRAEQKVMEEKRDKGRRRLS